MRTSMVLLPLAIMAASPALAGDAAAFDKAKFAALAKGMTKPEVIAAVGEPSQIMSANLVFLYQYWSPPDDTGKKHTDIVTVIFDKDDKLAIVSYYSNR